MPFFKFSRKEERAHYKAVAKGQKSVKADAKHSEKEQRAYARGRSDEADKNAAAYISKHGTPEQKAGLKAKNDAFKASMRAKKSQR